MKKDLRFLLCEPFGGLKKDTLDELEKVVKNFSVSFSLFCAENYIHLHSDRWIKYLGDDKEFETEELYNKFIESYDKKSN